VALEQRCQRAWHVRATGSTAASPLPAAFLDFMAASDGEGFIGFWEAAVRAELRHDPHLLD
jgi:L-ribulose-5-phosphate 4-epimerase